ncbi:serine acetyltransferase [Pedobacter psychrodurus]|uniref:serine O-acetyltransferase n=1 Tax=Pedobacter psychrodurus TaxID=2530456 RepID=UPI00292DD970|nr:serine acetyltransferase [Pedobacter psychrodurus]
MELIRELKFLKGNTKGRIFIICFRISSGIYKHKILRYLLFFVRIFYTIIVQWCLGIDISDKTQIGFGFNVFHGQGLVINEGTVIGKRVTVRQNSTIGNKRDGGKSPVIGNDVNIGANTCIIGEIFVGNNVDIGAGSVLVKNVNDNEIVVGNPARVVNVKTVSL